jgi:hypothetical protein
VYADFLEETGEPNHVARAHFIRTQVALETADPHTPQYDDMKALEQRALEWYLEDWRYELPEFVRYGSDVDQVKWRRGFADDLGPLTVRAFAQHGASALATVPLTSVHLREQQEPIAFEDFPALASISRLKLGPSHLALTGQRGQDDESTLTFDSLMSAPVFTSLRHLDLSENRITDAWLVRFTTLFPRTSFAPTLETLDLSSNFHITDAGANVLATAPGLDVLKELVVRDGGVTKSGLAMLRKRFGSRVR